jgi:hypothetical protein
VFPEDSRGRLQELTMTIGHYTRSSDASVSTVGDRVVLYHRVSKAALVLNPTGSWIWQQLTCPRTPDAIAGDLRRRFPALSADDAERDVKAFLAELVQHAMVSVGP